LLEPLEVLIIENKILDISLLSENIDSNIFTTINSVSLNNFSQYSVSRDSLYAIEIL